MKLVYAYITLISAFALVNAELISMQSRPQPEPRTGLAKFLAEKREKLREEREKGETPTPKKTQKKRSIKDSPVK